MASNRTFARDRATALRSQDRAELARLRDAVKVARAAITTWKRTHPKRRAEVLREIRDLAKQAKASERTTRATLIARIVKRRADYYEWWSKVCLEKRMRLVELQSLRLDLAQWRKQGSARRHEFRAVMVSAKAAKLEALSASMDREAETLFGALERAKSHAKSERYAIRSRAKTAKALAKPTVTRREKASEYSGGVEANLQTAVELAYWKHERRRVLAEAKRRGVTAADGVAEIVTELVEFDPDRAMGFLIDETEQWVRNETKARAA